MQVPQKPSSFKLLHFAILSVSFIFLCLSCSKEVTYEPKILSGKWKAYTSANGSPITYVLSIYEDSQGNIWAGTLDAGVLKFDGSQWINYTETSGLASDNDIETIIEDHNGNMWFGTESGLSQFNGSTWKTYNFSDGTYLQAVSSFKAGSSQILFGTFGHGLVIYDGSNFYTSYKKDTLDYVNAIGNDMEGNLWFGTNAGAMKYDGKHFTKILNTTYGLPYNKVSTIFLDSWGYLWFGFHEGNSVASYHDLTIEKIPLNCGFSTAYINTIVEDDLKNLWFGTLIQGISLYDGTVMRTISEAEGLVHYRVWCSLKDHNGNLWFGTSGGISVYTP